MRNSNRLQVLHRASQFARLHVLVADEGDLADLDLGSFLDHEGQAHRSRRDGTHFGGDGGELAAVRGQQLLDDHFRALHLGGIVLALLGQADLALLELVEHVALRHRAQPDVLDLADGWLFLDVDVDDPALGRGLALNPQVVEIAGVPQGVEVPLQRLLVVDLARDG